MSALRVLLVTGAYYPEISSSGVQARDLARALRDRVQFTVLTTAVNPALPVRQVVDGVTVHRLPIDVRRPTSRFAATIRLIATFVRLRPTIDLIHVHGFSTKNVALAVLARMFRVRWILSLHTAGQDDPVAVRARGRLAFWAYRGADVFLSVSPQLSERYRRSTLPAAKLEEVPNGIDLTRFRPADASERFALRRQLGLPADSAIVLFVGFFSRDKRPDVLFDAWMRVARRATSPVSLVCVGATQSAYFEVDPSLAERMRTGAQQAGLGDRLVFVEPTNAIDEYFRSADVYALPSAREAMPMALLEAMACGLPSVAWRLPRVTDVIIDDGVNGVLVDDVEALAGAIESYLADSARAGAIGQRARQTILDRFSVERTADRWFATYERVLGASSRP